REIRKLIYYVVWVMPCLLLHFIPVIGVALSPIIWFIFTSWMQVIQYSDYPFDNHKVPFKAMLTTLKNDRFDCLIFGSLVSFFTFVPVLNLIIMPVAVCGATAMWVERYRQQHTAASHTPKDPPTTTIVTN